MDNETSPKGERGDPALPKEALLLKILNMTTSDNDGVALVSIRKANKLLEDSGWTWEKLLSGKIKVVENPFKNIADPFGGFKQAPSAPPAPPATPTPSVAPRGSRTGRWGASPTPPAQPTKRSLQPRPTVSPGLGLKWVWDAALDDWITARDPNFVQPKPFVAPQASSSPASLGKKEISTKTNRYANHCWCCGIHVDSGAGWIFNPFDFNTKAPSGWQVACNPCNNKANVPIAASRAKKSFAPHQASSHVDLGDL